MLDYSHLSPPKMEAVGPWFRVHQTVALLKTNTPLQLIDLSDGTVLRDLGLTESETQARAYKKTQGISEAIHDAGWNVHGIRYASRLDPNRLCMALFDCPAGMIAVNDLEPLLAPANDGLLRFTLKHYRIPLIEDS